MKTKSLSVNPRKLCVRLSNLKRFSSCAEMVLVAGLSSIASGRNRFEKTTKPPKFRLVIVFLLLLAPLSSTAKNGGLLQTGAASLSSTEDSGGDLLITSSSQTTNFFNRHANLVKSVTMDVSANGIPTAVSTNTLSYDNRGNLVSEVVDVDFNSDGTVDRRSIVIYTNFIGNPRQLLTLIDSNADGTNDEIIASTYTFDSESRLVLRVTEIDADADGTPDFQSVETWSYDLVRHQAYYTNTTDLYSPGVQEAVSTAIYLLNDDGNFASATWVKFDPNVGTDLAGAEVFSYDKFGNLVEQTTRTLFPGPQGPAPSTSTTTLFYSHRGAANGARPVHQIPNSKSVLYER